MKGTLYDFLLQAGHPTNDALLGKFLEYIEARQLQLYPAQEAAILELFEEKNVILNTPTGSGKSLVAFALHFKSIAQGKRSVYTCPIKALVNEKWLALCREFGPENVGLATGDATINRDAPILCCTAEILANMALREGPSARVHDVIVDEFHYYSDRDRGVAWQIPLLALPQARFLLMSATLGDTSFFEAELTRLNRRETVAVTSVSRPVPLEFSYSETSLSHTLEQLIADGKGPVYVVHFTQLDAAQSAQDFTSINVASRDEKAALAGALEGYKFNSPYGPDIKRWLKHGIGLHHAGLLPKYRILVEQLAQKGLLKVICGTDTLGVGINVPIRTVLFTRLCKFDGQKTGILSARDFHQVAGRAGRKGFDNVGWVVVQAPEHVIENIKLEEKSKRDGKKVVKRRAPDHNFVPWDRNTFQRLIQASPERLVSRFQVTHGMLLNVLGRKGDGCAAMRDILRRCHETPAARKAHTRRAWQLFRSLTDRKIIAIVPPDEQGSYLQVHVDLQDDFSLDQTLSLYLLDTLAHLDPQAPDFALDVLTLVESILEDPDAILRKQLDKLKGRMIAEWKAQGMDYNDRMEELEKLEHPKPKREFLYETFNAFAASHPWVGQENIHPKSIAREMFESFRSFSDYVKLYELQRSEGVLLRHLSSVAKVLRHTVPDSTKNQALREMELYLSAMVKQVDSSLLDEWERLRNPGWQPPTDQPEARPPGADEAARDVTRDHTAFLALIRTRIFTFLRAIENGEHEPALAALSSLDHPDGEPWTPESLAATFQAYYATHERISLDPEARNARHTHLASGADQAHWRIQQVLVDPAADNDWMAEFSVDIPRSRDAAEPHLTLTKIGPIDTMGSDLYC